MIKKLTYGEAGRLRKLVKNRFLCGAFNGAGFKISQHKASYQPLADDIAQAVPGTETSVTTNRLRKFFYYTDPELCAPDKLEKPSFGDDFIQALFRYVESAPLPATTGNVEPAVAEISGASQMQATVPSLKFLFRKWGWRIAVILLMLLIALITWQQINRPGYWTEEFNSVSVDSLKSRGWEILDYDSVAFHKQLKPGSLTLYTYPGGFWVKKDSGEVPMIKNLVLKKIGVSECKISARVRSFNPYQDWQGAGVFIMGPDLSRENNLSVFFAYTRVPLSQDSIQDIQKIQMVLLINGKAEEKGWTVRLMNVEKEPIPEVEFEIEIEQKEVNISFRTKANWKSLAIEKYKIKLPFMPAYVGVGAAQGFTDENGRPLQADTIPAFFDYLKVEPLLK